MSNDALFVFGLIAVAGALMASNKVRYDIVALLVVLALMLSGTLSVQESLAGFGSPVVIVVAGLLVVGEMLARTGVAWRVGEWILRKGGTSESRLLVFIMLAAGILGSVMSSTAIVAIFIPIVLRVAAAANLNASRLLLPMSYAALISGMMTLIATSPNVVVHEELKGAGYSGFGFFSFTIVGLSILIVSIVYMLLLGRRLLAAPDIADDDTAAHRTMAQLWDDYRNERRHQRMRIDRRATLIGETIGGLEIHSRYGIRIVAMESADATGEKRIWSPGSSAEFKPATELLAIGSDEDLQRFADDYGVSLMPPDQESRQRWIWEIGAAVILVHPNSGLIGKSLTEIAFRSRFDLNVLGLRRQQESLEEYETVRLKAGDSLFVLGSWPAIQKLQSNTNDFVVIERPQEEADIIPSHRKMPAALLIVLGMVLLTVFDVVPLVAAVLLAAIGGVAARCLSMEDAYRAIPWNNIVLIAGMLPLADAMSVTGGSQMIVDSLLSGVGDAGPYVMLTVIFFLTAGLSFVLSNTATAVLVAPIALQAAEATGVSPFPFAIAVLIAASSAFATPVSTPVVTLVVDPGRYRFVDFLKVGLPMLFLSYLVTLLVAPLLYSF